MSLPNKTKSNQLHGHVNVNDAGTWKESESSYRGRSHGREEMDFESRLKQDLS